MLNETDMIDKFLIKPNLHNFFCWKFSIDCTILQRYVYLKVFTQPNLDGYVYLGYNIFDILCHSSGYIVKYSPNLSKGLKSILDDYAYLGYIIFV